VKNRNIHGETHFLDSDLPVTAYHIERRTKPMYHAEFGGSAKWFHTRVKAIRWLAWKIYFHGCTAEKAPGYHCAGEFVCDPYYVSTEPENITKAERRRAVNGIAMYKLGHNKLLYPPNLICEQCGTPYYYDECSTEPIYSSDQGVRYEDGVSFAPDVTKCKHACECGDELCQQ